MQYSIGEINNYYNKWDIQMVSHYCQNTYLTKTLENYIYTAVHKYKRV